MATPLFPQSPIPSTPSYCKAISMLCSSASHYQQSLKRRSILQMISQQHKRRGNISLARKQRTQQILASKIINKSHNHHKQQQLLELRWRNSLLRSMCKTSVLNSRREHEKNKRRSADSIRNLIASSHEKHSKEKQQTMRESYVAIKAMFVSQKENLKVRLESRERWRKGVVRRNLGEAREMVRRAKELDGMSVVVVGREKRERSERSEGSRGRSVRG